MLLSIVGTLITDNLTDSYGVPLLTSTLVFSAVLAVTFSAWWAVERTLSIHAIDTTSREAFHWLAILFTFALGTAAGDLIAEQFAIGYLPSVLIFGASLGDWLSQPTAAAFLTVTKRDQTQENANVFGVNLESGAPTASSSEC